MGMAFQRTFFGGAIIAPFIIGLIAGSISLIAEAYFRSITFSGAFFVS